MPLYWRHIKTTSNFGADQLNRCHEEISGLNFNIQHSVNGTMPFLDVLVKQQQVKFNTAVHIKPINPGHCCNGRNECPDRYKDSIIGAYIQRALIHCSTWQQVHEEIERATQVLINNNFSEKNIVHQTKKIIDK